MDDALPVRRPQHVQEREPDVGGARGRQRAPAEQLPEGNALDGPQHRPQGAASLGTAAVLAVPAVLLDDVQHVGDPAGAGVLHPGRLAHHPLRRARRGVGARVRGRPGADEEHLSSAPGVLAPQQEASLLAVDGLARPVPPGDQLSYRDPLVAHRHPPHRTPETRVPGWYGE
ncbi:hypothetical protein B0E37_05377 [Streptomyces sp. MH192]|nr:hypothetical protein [Streptomyces sp. MH192]